jgi:hypothetical protein
MSASGFGGPGKPGPYDLPIHVGAGLAPPGKGRDG